MPSHRLRALRSGPVSRAAGRGYFYSGLLDEIAVYNAVLSGASVAAHYAAAQ